MVKTKFMVSILALLIFVPGIASAVNIDSISVEPNSPWKTQDFTITTTCGKTGETHTVYIGNITRNSDEIPGSKEELLMTKEDDVYKISGNELKTFLEERGGFKAAKYSFYVVCKKDGESQAEEGQFTVRNLNATVVEDSLDETYYTGQKIEIPVEVYEEVEGQSPILVKDDVNLTMTIGDKSVSKTFFRKDTGDWVLTATVPNEPGTYQAMIDVKHAGGEDSISKEIRAKEDLVFDIDVSRSDYILSLVTEAKHKDEEIAVTEDDLDVDFDGDSLNDELSEESVSKESSEFQINLPEKDPGIYDLTVNFERTELPEASYEEKITFPKKIGGRFEDSDEESIEFKLKFLNEDREKVVDGEGSYSTEIVPDEYDVGVKLEDANLKFKEVAVDDWQNPIKYHKYGKNVDGLRVAGLHAFTTSFDYSEADLEFGYNTDGFEDPSELKIFRCEDWNFDGGKCYGSWETVSGSLEEVSNTAKVEDAGLGAYAVGKRDKLSISYSLEEDVYLPDDILEVSGVVKNLAGKTIQNANITLEIESDSSERKTITDKDGIFDFSAGVPKEDSEYILNLTAEKKPYISNKISTDFEVKRKPSLEIVAPDSIDLKPNTTKQVNMYVRNNGYKTLEDIEPKTEEVPFLEKIEFKSTPIYMNQSRDVLLTLEVPHNATPDLYDAEISFLYANDKATAPFGINVEEPTSYKEVNTSETVTGRFIESFSSISVSSVLDGNLPLKKILIAVISVQVILVLFFYWRSNKNIGKTLRKDITNLKGSIRGKSEKGKPTKTNKPQKKSKGVMRDENMIKISHIKSEIKHPF